MSVRPYIYFSEMHSPIGLLTVGKSERGICFIEFGSIKKTCSTIDNWLKKKLMNVELVENDIELQPALKQLEEYFRKERTEFDLPLDLIGTKFQTLVWSKVKEIAYGETKSYKQIAMEIGAPKAVRAIGGANNQNPIPIIIPCHRVIGSNGSMVGYGGGLDKKEYLLKLEGSIEKIS
ncbi:O-6-methylguanine DNA methyltransferase [Evansella vedderi]|uniref:Methylated-DNA--protein-cysteine methyltransferase n=1 Tax=Evansella vedderi TaxID=38282 RepID=A0ABU0A217_9BACI|nr:methylated-DNA--[protein]-cysteine S-methyltransferase [Evansella vedderi]MDQ0257021.1 O-6-methylguanine DNA methyltransferase [Evansella vedderi]